MIHCSAAALILENASAVVLKVRCYTHTTPDWPACTNLSNHCIVIRSCVVGFDQAVFVHKVLGKVILIWWHAHWVAAFVRVAVPADPYRITLEVFVKVLGLIILASFINSAVLMHVWIHVCRITAI